MHATTTQDSAPKRFSPSLYPPSVHPLSRPAGGGRVRVGIDLTEIAEVEAAIARFGDRYERRLFTETERAEATGTPAVRAASLAARFAAKEATIKILHRDGVAPPWRSIEVRRGPHGQPDLHLAGDAARLAAQAGLSEWSVSLTHDGGMAAAVVAAIAVDEGHTENRENA